MIASSSGRASSIVTFLLAGVVLDVIDWADVPGLVPVDRTFIPEPAAERVYDRLASELPKAYGGLKGVFARLRP